MITTHQPPIDVLILGAGVSGLSLAQALSRRGLMPLLLERARGVGGRCATRRLDGSPVDFGLPFLHGRDPAFLAALASVTDATPVPGWPAVREGHGLPCQPEAFEGRDRLLAFREGLTRFPKHLARGLHVRLEAKAVALEQAQADDGGPRLRVRLRSGETLEARAVALTLPVPQATALLETMTPASEAMRSLSPLLEEVHTASCLTLIARYPDDAPRPRWDIYLPEASTMVQAILNDATKRAPGAPAVLVIQAGPGFSRERLEDAPEAWARDLLWEAAEFLGGWAERPGTTQAHRWRYARVNRASELVTPIAVRLENGAPIGLCGDAFSPAGGAEGAYLSGLALAARLHVLLDGGAEPSAAEPITVTKGVAGGTLPG